MKWNPDFEIAALLVTLVFNIFFCTERRLPLKQNHYFSHILGVEFGVIFCDLIASAISSEYWKYSFFILNITNVIYFLFLILLIIEFFFYTISLTEHAAHLSQKWKMVLQIPFMLTGLAILLTPFTGMIFTVDPVNGYQRGWGYMLLFYMVCFYIFMSIGYITVFHKNVTGRQLISIYMFCILEFSGVVLQIFFFPYILLTNGFSALAIAVIYLSLQNPDFYKNKMTRLFNADAYMEIAKEKIGREEVFTALGIVMDNFPIARKTYGKEHLDLCLKEIAEFLQKMYPQMPSFYFHDGCFVIMDTEGGNFEQIKAEIEQRFEQPWLVENGEIYFSICTALWPRQIVRTSAIEMVDGLQMAMEKATEKGNGICVVIDEELIRQMQYDAQVENALSRALENNLIDVYFQPIYSTAQNKVTAAEALARLYDSELGFISPEEFIVKAEQNGSIMQLGRQVFEKTCQFIQGNDLEALGIDYIEINLSPVQCLREQLAQELMEIAARHAVPMKLVNLEITETATTDVAVIRENMHTLSKNGTTFSLDDYGTGFSNLINILDLPLHIVKIDKSIVWAYFSGARNVLPHVVKMFKSQNLKIVVEGVETQKMADELAQMGCDYEQGFYFSKPVPSETFLKYVRQINCME